MPRPFKFKVQGKRNGLLDSFKEAQRTDFGFIAKTNQKEEEKQIGWY